jgi:hypothetical protein
MKTRSVFMMIACLLMFTLTAQAQVGNFVKGRVNTAARTVGRTIAREADKEVEKAVERAVMKELEKLRPPQDTTKAVDHGSAGSISGRSGKGGFNLSSLGMGTGEVTLKYNDEYKFDGRLVMEIESFSDGEPTDKMLYTILYSKSSPNSAIEMKKLDSDEKESMFFVFDQINNCMLMITDSDGKKSGIISSIAGDTTMYDASKNTTPSDVVVDDTYMGGYKKTGRTKTIAGYKCDEYVAHNVEENIETAMWYTRDMNLNVNRKGMATAGVPFYYGAGYYYGGYMMEMESKENGKVSSRMTTKEVDNNINQTINAKEYELMQFEMGVK